MQYYLKIQRKARKRQAEREFLQSGEHEANGEKDSEDGASSKVVFPVIHFVETASSVLRELPWILPKEYKVACHIYVPCNRICTT